MNPANTILDELERVIRAEMVEGRTDINRYRSVSEDRKELPFFNVKQAAIDPLPSASTFDQLGAVFNFAVDIYDKGRDSKDVILGLNQYAVRLFAVLMKPRALNLPPYQMGWSGTSEPNVDTNSTGVAVELKTRWQLRFNFDVNTGML